MSVKKMVRCRQGVFKVIGVTPTPLRFGDKVRAAGFWRRGSLLTGEEIASPGTPALAGGAREERRVRNDTTYMTSQVMSYMLQ